MSTDRSKMLTGLMIIAAGTILLLNNLEITAINIWPYWPLLLILWGANSLLGGSRNLGAQGVSLFVILLGFVFLANSLGWADIDLSQIFRLIVPVLIIILGASLFFGRPATGKTTLAFLGGVSRDKATSWNLESGSYLAFMGGIELDLRNAVIPEGETFLDLTAFMGGIEIRVPADIPVEADGFALLGGIEVFGRGSGGIVGSVRTQSINANDSKVIKIQGRAIMGGIEIKRI